MVSVMIIDDAYNSDEEHCIRFSSIYIPLVISLLRSKGVNCETVKLKGLEKMYSLLGKTKENIIYVPKIEISKSHVSFIFVDSVASVSTSFKIASILRKERAEKEDGQVVFVEQLRDNDLLNACSPLLVDNIRLKQNSEDGFYNKAMACAVCVTDAVNKFFAK